jgi:hypothetical protein
MFPLLSQVESVEITVWCRVCELKLLCQAFNHLQRHWKAMLIDETIDCFRQVPLAVALCSHFWHILCRTETAFLRCLAADRSSR